MRPKLSPEPEPQGLRRAACPLVDSANDCRGEPETLNLAPAGPSPTTATSSGRLRGPPLLIADSERMADDRRSLIAPKLPIRGGLSLRRSDERLRADLPVLCLRRRPPTERNP